jgi:hypothetical protein
LRSGFEPAVIARAPFSVRRFSPGGMKNDAQEKKKNRSAEG